MIAFVGLGANLGNRLETLKRAIVKIKHLPDSKLSGESSFYETEPVGPVSQPNYLNAVLQIETGLSARELLDHFLRIEASEGRVRTYSNASRTLDIDLLFFGQEVIQEEGLRIPHPRLHLRKFTLIPLVELAPEWRHPLLQKSVRELLKMNDSVESVVKV
jgi:2-amino-4-hydroxy-6-hydroxymethyldihydropteridine diphosphokinase